MNYLKTIQPLVKEKLLARLINPETPQAWFRRTTEESRMEFYQKLNYARETEVNNAGGKVTNRWTN